MLRAPLALALAAFTLAPAAEAQAFKEEKHERLGLNLVRPRKYKAMALQPNEPFIQLRYIEEEDKRKPKNVRPEFLIVRIDFQPDPEPEVEEPEAEDEDDEERSRSKPAPEAKRKVELPISTLERWVERRLNGFELGAEHKPQKAREQDGYAYTEYELKVRGRTPLQGWAFVWHKPERTYALIGVSGKDDFEDHRDDLWRKCALKIEIEEPTASKEAAKWTRFYERRPEFKGGEYRVKVRSEMVKGWKAEDTENYILVYSTKDQALIRDLKQRLEAIRRAYTVLFPASREITAVSTVRICKDADEYRKYGGPAGSGGYWNYVTEELVFFDYDDREGERGSGKKDSRIVLYHEAFHQYIFYSVGELAPHSWFNEGYGDYWSGSIFNRGGKVQKVAVNPWRIGTIQKAIDDYRHVPWREIIEFEQKDYYNPAIRHICYAQGWSMVYFLNTSKQVQKNPQWAEILPVYFETLKTSHAEEMERLAELGQADNRAQREAANLRSRQAAVKAAFEGVDLKAIEEAWMEYTRGLKAPR